MKRYRTMFALTMTVSLLSLIGSGHSTVGAQEPARKAVPQSVAGTYVLDPAHSTIGFTVRHLMINDIPGRFRDFAGTIKYNPDSIGESAVTFTAKAASVDTAIEARDKHLRTSDFFDVEKYPEISFKSKRIEKAGQNSFVAHGDFTMHGVTKLISIPFKLHGTVKDPWDKIRLGVEAGMTIDRQNYGITWGGSLDNGGLVISNEVKINLLIEAIKQ